MSDQELNEHMARLMGYPIYNQQESDGPKKFPCFIDVRGGLYLASDIRDYAYGYYYFSGWHPTTEESQAWMVVDRIVKNDPEYADYVLTLGASGDIETGDCYMFQLFKHPECREFRGVSSTRAAAVTTALSRIEI